MQGTKYYGQQFLAPLKTPFDETDPRHIGPNFYFDLEDYLRSRVKSGAQFTWSALRPNPVCGFSSGSYMNLVVSIAVYASICKELGLALRLVMPFCFGFYLPCGLATVFMVLSWL